MEARLFLEKDRRKVGRTSRVAPPVVIREESSHRSPGHLTGYRLPKEKRSGIEKNGRETSGRFGPVGRSLSSRYPARGSAFVFVILERKLVEEGNSTVHSHVRDYSSVPLFSYFMREYLTSVNDLRKSKKEKLSINYLKKIFEFNDAKSEPILLKTKQPFRGKNIKKYLNNKQ